MSSCLCALPPTLRLKEAEGVREPLKLRIITTLVLHMHSEGGDERNNFINCCQRAECESARSSSLLKSVYFLHNYENLPTTLFKRI